MSSLSNYALLSLLLTLPLAQLHLFAQMPLTGEWNPVQHEDVIEPFQPITKRWHHGDSRPYGRLYDEADVR